MIRLRPRAAALALAALPLLLVAAPGVAAAAGSTTLLVQWSFPKQTRTNAQIESINAAFGSDFDTWDDVANLSLGWKLFHDLRPWVRVGVELDASRGGIDGAATVATEAGPARLSFDQSYDVFADAMAVAHFLPCPTCRRAVPFVLAGAGVGYEKDTTTLTLRNDYLDLGLRVDNDGWFPVATAGVGLEIPFGASPWGLELGVAYYWGRLEHRVPAEGALAPAPEVLADTDSTGPNVWAGVTRRF